MNEQIKKLPIYDHEKQPSINIGKYFIKVGMEDNTKVWIGTQDGEGGDFPIHLLEPIIDKFYKKHF